ncbi:unnamed protein product [Gongylonema pulchrum]|uniref:Transmembrane protein n=1 Tax=Gongylonema pulchrum TaxID=637853 RepID=A0A183DNV7_9BILA|nr:unnamed protein product [Gongylonema pulchrum]
MNCFTGKASFLVTEWRPETKFRIGNCIAVAAAAGAAAFCSGRSVWRLFAYGRFVVHNTFAGLVSATAKCYHYPMAPLGPNAGPPPSGGAGMVYRGQLINHAAQMGIPPHMLADG